MRSIVTLLLTFFVFGASTLRADFSYTQTTRMTGGSLLNGSRFIPGSGALKEPHTYTIAVKGGKMVTYDNDTATIMDADAETITAIDFKKKQYSVITFAEMKQAMDALRQQMAQIQAQLKQAQEQMPAVNPLDSFKVSAKETGQTKTIAGLNTKEVILTMEFAATLPGAPPDMPANLTTMDTWLAPTLPGYEEVTAFGMKLASKMADMTAGMNPMAMYRQDVGKSMAAMEKEMAKMNGIPVYQTMTMKAAQPSGPSAGDAAKSGAKDAATQGAIQGTLGRSRLGGLAGGLGGLGGRGKKDESKPAEAQQPQQAQQPTWQQVTLMEQVTELTNFSSTVDASKFSVPAGFKQVEHEMKKMSKQK